VMTAAGDEQTDPHAGAVCDIKFFNVGVIHFFSPDDRTAAERICGSNGDEGPLRPCSFQKFPQQIIRDAVLCP
jgi:hypothetical protein